MLRMLPGRAVLPAVLLAGLVFFVFATLQNYGPESAVRRFHEAVLTNNDAELQDVCLDPVDSLPVQELKVRLIKIFSLGAHIRLHDLEREPSIVYVSVLYHAANGGYASTVWATQKTPTGWKVDANQTWNLWQSM